MFQGFAPETIAFFTALRFNNNRDFFEENRPAYEQFVRGPLVALAEALAPVVTKIDPQIDSRPMRAVSRIHRDLRFRNDKTPYRDYMWIGFRRVGEARLETCGFYFDISDRSANWGCGFYHMQPQTMQNLRRLLAEDSKRVQKVVRDKRLLNRFALLGDAYARQHQPPEGMPADLAALYRKKSLYAEHHLQSMDDLFSPRLMETIAEDYGVLTPLYALLRETMVSRLDEGRLLP